jgi:type II secretory pathway predicted ATPase ExeA
VRRNPYRPGVGTPPPYLADRDAQLRRFSRYLDDFPEVRRNVRVTGLRGVGKTVLLKEYRKEAKNVGWVVIRRDVSHRLSNEADFAIAISDDLQKAANELSLTAKLKNQLSKARGVIKQIEVGLPGDVTVSMAGGGGRPSILEDRVRDGLREVGQLAKAAGRGVAFLYDEAHLLYDRPRKEQFPLSTLLGAFVEVQDDEDEEYPVMLVVSGLPPLVNNLQEARSHAERLFEAEPLADLSLEPGNGGPSAAVLALTEPVKGTGLSYAQATAAQIVRDVNGYPYFIQKFGEALWDSAVQAGEPEIDDTLYRSTRRLVRDALDREFFEGRYGAATPGDQMTLRVAASLGGEQFEVRRLGEEITSRNQNANQQSVNRLLQGNLLYRVQQGVYAYTAPMFGDFVRRKYPRQESDL